MNTFFKHGQMLAAVAALAIPASAIAAERQVVVISSTTGPTAFASVSNHNGIKMALDEVNKSDFLGNGDTIKAYYEDDGGDRNQTFAIISKYAVGNPDVLAIIGPTGVGVGVPSGGLANELKIPLYAFANGTAMVSTGKYSFMSHEGAASSVPKMVDYAYDTLALRKCAVVFAADNDAYVTQANAFMSGFEGKGTPMIDKVQIKTTDSDFAAAATRVASLDLDCIYVAAPPAPVANLVRQIKMAGVPDEVRILSATSATSPDFLKMAGPAAEGVTMLGDWVPGGMTDAGSAFIKNYEARFETKLDAWAPDGYTMGYVMANAIKNAGSNPTRDLVRDALANTKDFPVIIGNGTYSIDPVTRLPKHGAILITIKDGQYRVVSR